MSIPLALKFPVSLAGLTALALPFCATSCRVQSTAGTVPTAAEQEAEAAEAMLPKVITPGWRVRGSGKPFMDVSGYSSLFYAKEGSPKDVVEVIYHGKANPRINTQDPEFVVIMGQRVQTYPSGNEDVAFATQPLLLTAPNGRSAFYSFQFHNENLYRSRKIPEFGW